jgi:1,2-diacylglycerol 3-beta-galactosyltransferase
VVRAKKVLIMAVNAGGGHMSNARSIEAWSKVYYGDSITVEVYDAFKYLIHIFGRDPISLLYYIMSVHVPFTWKWFVDLVNKTHPTNVDKYITNLGPLFGKKHAIKKLLEFQPDLILTTYAPIVAPLQKILKKLNIQAKVKLVITDIFSAPNYWLGGKADEYYVMSEMAYNKTKNFISEKPVRLMSPLLHPKFFSPILSNRKKQVAPTILILAGGEGVHNLNAIVELLATNPKLKLDVVCAKDHISLQMLTALKTQYHWDHVEISGFVSNIEERIHGADIVITKAGPATIFEILTFKKPLICYHYIFGTEQENIDFLIEHNYGIYEPDIQLIPKHIDAILSGVTKLQYPVIKNDYKPVFDQLFKA